jgi:ferredoxin-NADP reductase
VNGERVTSVRASGFHETEAELSVARRDEAADGVVALTLVHPDGAELPAWTPGAHIDLLLDGPMVRQYSLCSSPSDRYSWRIGVLLAPDSRGGSRFVHEHLGVGARVRVRGPRNHFPLVASRRYQFIAGGIGITPILMMIEHAETAGADWNLLYGGRQRESMAFVADLLPYGERVRVWPQDEFGLLDLDALLGRPADDTLVYCCGPEPLLGAVEQRCATWPAGSLHVERFAPKTIEEPSADALATFEVVCQRTGMTVTVPEGMSIFEALEKQGVDVIGSCLEGTCGTCETTVIDGVPDHRDSILTPAEQASNEMMMICVSRSRSERLVLDV